MGTRKLTANLEITMSERGTGRTSRQMIEAPEGAFFVWCNGRTEYALSLAARLGRHDLKILSVDNWELANRGTHLSLIFDHAHYMYPGWKCDADHRSSVTETSGCSA